ncbi:MAG: HTH-type transcriptional regulator BenM [Verrucomicrobiota bacterium]|jgi:DNA-binding transcriptional LysR family regulator
MNVHHLELFYYVAKHGGIMPAVRNIPYGIQQPAVSAQVAQLEEFLGVSLFQRRPFALTEAGAKLFKFIQPFFAGLDKVADELQGGQARHLRIGASTIILRDHVPGLLQGLRRKFTGLKVSLREGYPAHLENLLLQDEIDVAVTLVEQKPAAGLQALTLMTLPLVLLVHKDSGITSVEKLWQRDRIEDSLICLPQTESVTRQFLGKLAKLGVEWWPCIEASSMDLVQTYVASGLGVGVGVVVPGNALPANVRALPLTGFEPLVIGVIWRGKATALVEAFLTEARGRAGKLAK